MDKVDRDLEEYFQILKENGYLYDEIKPVMDAFSEIEKKLISNEEEKSDSNWN